MSLSTLALLFLVTCPGGPRPAAGDALSFGQARVLDAFGTFSTTIPIVCPDPQPPTTPRRWDRLPLLSDEDSSDGERACDCPASVEPLPLPSRWDAVPGPFSDFGTFRRPERSTILRC